ncbi:MAG TPA: TIGR01906 family membrane protein [Anaerolineales bacterium]|nr:TIGR01906 family membrane protein [Anaerolineales bacterium]
MPNFILKLLRILLISLIPVILILGSARLLATDSYLAFEYGKASFPPDPYGFTPQQRFILASTNIHYVRAHLPDDELSKQTLNGVSVYNEREVTHMADVQVVFQIILRIWQAAFILLLLLGAVFVQNGKREAFASALQWGGLVTAGIIFAIALLAIFAWQTWFDLFHRFLFVPGSWLFSYTDTLIRLFPMPFWFDATLTIFVLAFVGGILLALIGWRGKTLMVRRPVDVMQAA